jgi:hypothetical protein
MNQELTEKLFMRYPFLYADRNKPMTESLVCFGFEFSSGWFDLVNELSAALEKEIEQWIKENGQLTDEGYMSSDFPRAAQMKEKFGTLCFYMTHATDKMYELISEAEKKSETICEECSQPGTLRTKGWWRTLCDECEEKRKNRWKE